MGCSPHIQLVMFASLLHPPEMNDKGLNILLVDDEWPVASSIRVVSCHVARTCARLKSGSRECGDPASGHWRINRIR